MVGIAFNSAGCTLEFCLRRSVAFVHTAALAACLTGIPGRNNQKCSARPCQLAYKLPPELEPALIQYGPVQSCFGPKLELAGLQSFHGRIIVGIWKKSTTSDMEDTVSFSFVFAEILKLNLWSLTGRTIMSICLSSILPKQQFHLWSAGLKGVSGRLIRKKGCPSIPKNSGEALSGRQAILRAVAAERRSPYCANISNSNGHRN